MSHTEPLAKLLELAETNMPEGEYLAVADLLKRAAAKPTKSDVRPINVAISILSSTGNVLLEIKLTEKYERVSHDEWFKGAYKIKGVERPLPAGHPIQYIKALILAVRGDMYILYIDDVEVRRCTFLERPHGPFACQPGHGALGRRE